MKGKILGFSIVAGGGVISGDDGKRYVFVTNDWKSETLPHNGDIVDFLISDNLAAIEVYLEKGGKNEITDERYKSAYCSSDDRFILGFCGGLGHKYGLPSGMIRMIVFFSLFFFVGWLYFVGIFLPKLPTKNVKIES